MSTISEERVKDILEFGAGRIISPITDDEIMEMARIALASLEAEPVAINDYMAFAFHHALSDSSLGADDVEEIKTGLRAAFANVTYPPATVSVPECFKRLLHHAYGMTMGHDWNKGTMAGHHRTKLCQAVEECRAAMLQGADGNSPVIPAQPLAWKVIFTMHGQPGSNFKKIFEDEVAMESAVSLHRSGGFDVQVIPLIAQPHQ